MRSDAAAPTTITTVVNVSFPAPYYTALCGVSVRFFNTGTLVSKLYADASGAIVREIDTTQSDKVGWVAPTTGKSIVFPNSAKLTTDYPSGASVGNAALITGSGLDAKIPGLGADAGRAVFAGHVAAIDPDGVPIVAFDQFLSSTGHSNDPAAFD